MAKDFTGIKAGEAVKSAIAEATQEEQKKRKDRKTYDELEAIALMNQRKTAGRKGVKLPRINLAFSAENYTYITTMARAAGLTLTDFVNMVIDQHREDNTDKYQQAIDFRNSLKR